MSVDSTRPCMAVPWLACALASECSVGGLSAGDETTRSRSASSELREGSAADANLTGARSDQPMPASPRRALTFCRISCSRFAISLLLFSRPPRFAPTTEPPLTNQRCTEAALTMAQAAAASLAATPSLAVVAVRCALAVRTHPHAFNSPSVPTCQAFGNSNFGGDAFGGGNMSQGGGFAVDNNGPDAKVRERIRWHRNSHR